LHGWRRCGKDARTARDTAEYNLERKPLFLGVRDARGSDAVSAPFQDQSVNPVELLLKEFMVARKKPSKKKKTTKASQRAAKAAATKKRAKKSRVAAKKAKKVAKKASKAAKKPAAKKVRQEIGQKFREEAEAEDACFGASAITVVRRRHKTENCHREEKGCFRNQARGFSRGNIYYITTAIAYPNGLPHIGHAYEAIATDALARFQRLDGKDVFFLTGPTSTA